MPKGSFRHCHLMIVAAGGLALALVAAPLQFQSDDPFASKSAAFAKDGGKGGGKGGGGGGNSGGGGGKGGGGGNSGGGGVSSASASGDKNKNGSGWAFGKRGHTSHNTGAGNAFGHNDGHSPNIASRLKGLNAAHASETALANAAPNSRVGLIAAYLRNAESTLAAPQNIADLVDLNGLRDGAETDLADAQAALAAAQAALTAAGGEFIPDNVALVAAVVAAQAAVDLAKDKRDAAQADVDAALDAFHSDPDVRALADALVDGQIALDDTEAAQLALDSELAEAEAAALSAAANMDVDDEMTQAVDALLGLE